MLLGTSPSKETIRINTQFQDLETLHNIRHSLWLLLDVLGQRAALPCTGAPSLKAAQANQNSF